MVSLFDNYEIDCLTKNRILIFCTSEGLKLMSESEHWFADGTHLRALLLYSHKYPQFKYWNIIL